MPLKAKWCQQYKTKSCGWPVEQSQNECKRNLQNSPSEKTSLWVWTPLEVCTLAPLSGAFSTSDSDCFVLCRLRWFENTWERGVFFRPWSDSGADWLLSGSSCGSEPTLMRALRVRVKADVTEPIPLPVELQNNPMVAIPLKFKLFKLNKLDLNF